MLPASPSLAWGKFGHLTVCDLAYRNLTDPAKAALKVIFHAGQGGIDVPVGSEGEVRHYSSFNVGCLEEDELPRRHADDHFINVARDVGSIAANECPGQTSCVLAGIGRDVAILKDTSKSDVERVLALMAIGHWVGDVHQPLHVSFADDRGGNRVLARLQGKCGKSTYRVENLHGMWDNCLLEAGLFERVRKRADFKKTWSKNTITYRAVDTLLANTNLVEEQAMVGGEPWQWAEESYAITLRPDVQYCLMQAGACRYDADREILIGSDETTYRKLQLDQSYLQTFEQVAQKRVRLAGFRLAHLLNQALDPSYTGPIKNSGQLKSEP